MSSMDRLDGLSRLSQLDDSNNRTISEGELCTASHRGRRLSLALATSSEQRQMAGLFQRSLSVPAGWQPKQVEEPNNQTLFRWTDPHGQFSRQDTQQLLQVLQQQNTQALVLKNPKQQQLLSNAFKQLQALQTLLGHKEQVNLTVAEVDSLQQGLANLSQALPKGDLKELTQLLAVQVRVKGLLIARDELKAQMYQQLKRFEQPGNNSQINLSLQLTAGAGLFGLDLLKGNVGIDVGLYVEADDDTGILEFRTGGLQLGITAGEKKIMQASGDVKVTKGVVYNDNSLSDFIDRHVDNMMGALFTAGAGKGVKHLKGWQENRQFAGLQQQALAGQHRLNNLLLKQGLASQVESQVLQPKEIPLRIPIVKKQFNAGLQLFHRVFQGTYSRIKFTGDVHKYDRLLDSIKEDSSRIQRFKKQYYMPSINRLAEVNEKNTAQLALPDRAKRIIDELAAEFEHYSQIVQFCDYAKQHPRQVDKQQLKQARQVKTSIEANRGAKGRGEFTKAVIVAYSALQQVYQASTSASHASHEAESVTHFENRLKRPLFHISDKTFLEKLSFKADGEFKRNYESGTFAISLPAEHAALGINVNYFNTIKHPNHYRQGEFLEFNLTLKGQLGLNDLTSLMASERAAFSGLNSIFQANGSDASISAEEIAKQVGDSLSFAGDFGLEAGASVNIRLRRSENNKWALQFVRLGTQSGINIAGGASAPVAPGVEVGGKVKVNASQSTVRREWLGNNTLSYILPIFNTLQGTDQAGRWDAFIQRHQAAFGKIFRNIATSRTTIHQEVQSLLTQIGNGDLKARLEKAVADYKQQPTQVNFELANEAFNAFLFEQREVYKAKNKPQWTDKTGDA
ncbi:hypothetical protein H0A36_10810 [Endozoicomonas sp. SM1973]|uniref:Uncharacterized protein n=1 Tax=Spartinivicinus marinus TaxID=2994442 RepID=A0A853I9F3_9GAMM|nr:hypothetical protein [Spartinivicinus marinus]MCX4024853.1 hypothetical protein [Spartinivicinus marinus]NYZ66501.1 hypothetical protein [Spartinivicinus marinus]